MIDAQSKFLVARKLTVGLSPALYEGRAGEE